MVEADARTEAMTGTRARAWPGVRVREVDVGEPLLLVEASGRLLISMLFIRFREFWQGLQ